MQVQRASADPTRDHWWWRPGWQPGTRYLTFHLTFELCPELRAEADRFAPLLTRSEYVDPVPPQWLHLTMTGVGHAGELSAQARQAVAAAVFTDLDGLDAEPLVLDRLYLGAEGLALSTDSPDWLDRLKERQESAVQAVLPESEASDGVFRPHVSLAYFSGPADAEALMVAVDELGPRPVTLSRPVVSLLELGRDDRVYTWRVLDQREIPMTARR